MKKQIAAIVMAAALLVAMVPTALAAGTYSDIEGHWGEAAIDRWVQAGVAEGREDGSFAPNEAMTRAETASMFVNLLHLTAEADVSQYTDLALSSPYYHDFAKCVAAGIFTGTGAATMSPDGELTREQLFTTFARALGIQPVSTSSVTFADGEKVSDWAAGYVNALANMGAVRGVSDGSLLPQEAINRASVMAVLDQAISVYASDNGATVGESEGIVLVVANQVNVVGEVENLVVAAGSANVSNATVASASVVGDNAALNISGNAAVTEVSVSGENAQINVSGQAQVSSVTVAPKAAGTAVRVTNTAVVGVVDSQAEGVAITGEGTVTNAVVSGNNTTVNTTGTNLTVSQGTTGVTENGSAVSGGATVETAPSTPSIPSNPSTPVIPPHTHSYTVTEIKAADAPETTVALQYTCYAGDHTYVELNGNAQACVGNSYYVDLNNALAAGGTVDLLKDITATTTTFKINGKTVTLNLNGYTISASGYDGAIYAMNGAQVTINGEGSVVGNDDRNYGMAIWSSGTGTHVTINGGTYTNNLADGHTDDQMDMIYASNGGTITINGGTFNCITPKWTLNVRDADYKDNPKTIQVTGGTFRNYNPAASIAENPVANFVADGYTVTTSQNGEDTWYTVAPLTSENSEAVVNGKYYESFEDAIAAANGNEIVLCSDVSLADRLALSTAPVIIDLASHKFSLKTNDGNDTISVTQNQSLTIKNGTLDLQGQNIGIAIRGGGSVTLQNVTYSCNTDPFSIYEFGSSLTLIGCSVTAGSDAVYVLSTNAKDVTTHGAIVNIQSSTLDATASRGGTAVLFNIPGTLNIDNSTIKGVFHAVIARGGDVTIKDSTLDNQIAADDWNAKKDYFDSTNWGTGNMVQLSALTIGNKAPNDYQYPTHCTLINTNITVGEGQRTVYVYGNATADLGAYLTFDTSSNVGEVVVGGGYVSVNGEVVSPVETAGTESAVEAAGNEDTAAETEAIA